MAHGDREAPGVDQAATRVPHWSQNRLPGGRVAAHPPQFRASSAQPQVEQKIASVSGRGPRCGHVLSEEPCARMARARSAMTASRSPGPGPVLGPQGVEGLCAPQHRIVLVGQLAGSLIEPDLRAPARAFASPQVLRLVVRCRQLTE